tara:strand:+ start:740 stop:970 length:231 start_codon:yes stop_codon:yes gene_type:complete
MITDDKTIKKTIITFKNNLLSSKSYIDYSTGKSYVDNCGFNSLLFTGTDSELSIYVDKLMEDGYHIQDFYDYEEND